MQQAHLRRSDAVCRFDDLLRHHASRVFVNGVELRQKFFFKRNEIPRRVARNVRVRTRYRISKVVLYFVRSVSSDGIRVSVFVDPFHVVVIIRPSVISVRLVLSRRVDDIISRFRQKSRGEFAFDVFSIHEVFPRVRFERNGIIPDVEQVVFFVYVFDIGIIGRACRLRNNERGVIDRADILRRQHLHRSVVDEFQRGDKVSVPVGIKGFDTIPNFRFRLALRLTVKPGHERIFPRGEPVVIFRFDRKQSRCAFFAPSRSRQSVRSAAVVRHQNVVRRRFGENHVVRRVRSRSAAVSDRVRFVYHEQHIFHVLRIGLERFRFRIVVGILDRHLRDRFFVAKYVLYFLL